MMNTRYTRTRLGLTLALAVAAASCAGDDVIVAPAVDRGGADSTAVGDGAASPTDVAVTPDLAADAPPADDVAADEGQPDTPGPRGDAGGPAAAPECDDAGGLNCPCTANVDCADGNACVDGPTGPICTIPCVDRCPEGFACRQRADGGADVSFLCIPVYMMLCAPCREHDDCQDAGALCVDFGEEGSFCGAACTGPGTCPDGYTCTSLTVRGVPVQQCLPAPLACQCPPRAILLGSSTDCAVGNGWGVCQGARFCAEDGLTACDAREPAAEVCDDADNDCDGVADEGFDVGGVCMVGEGPCRVAGFTACSDDGSGSECRPEGAPTGVAEVCNGADDDCDGETDEGFDVGGSCSVGVGGCAVAGELGCAPDGTTTCVGTAGAPSEEICNGVDDDCDDETDEGCDDDADGWCDALMIVETGASCANGSGDCDDTDGAINPGAVESCLTEADDDCNGLANAIGAPGCVRFYADGDGDGAGVGDGVCQCAPAAPYTASVAGDCADNDAARSPLLVERCDTDIDDNCDDRINEPGAMGCTVFYRDGDDDRVGVLDDSVCACEAAGDHTATAAGDCDDGASDVHPGHDELCDAKDNDCDSVTDEFVRSCEGTCGSGTEHCSAGLWGECTAVGGDECEQGESDREDRACGNCGTQSRTRTCSGTCTWGAWSGWSACSDQGACAPGATDRQSQGCGNCGTRTRSRTCSDSCAWGGYSAWSGCSGQGECSPGATTTGGCTAPNGSAEQCAQRTCNNSCRWGSCQLAPGAECFHEGGSNWRCCGSDARWQFCLPKAYGCQWSSDCVACSGCGCN